MPTRDKGKKAPESGPRGCRETTEILHSTQSEVLRPRGRGLRLARRLIVVIKHINVIHTYH